MAGYGSLPDFQTYLDNAKAGEDAARAVAAQRQAATPAPAPVQPGDQPNWLSAGLSSGFRGALAQAAAAGEAGARVVGADSLADKAAAYSDEQRALATADQRPDLEAAPWYDPKALGYRVAQSGTGIGLGLAGAIAATLAAPEEGVAAGLTGLGGILARNAGAVGGAVGAFPLAVGSNVETAKDYYGKLDQGSAAKALALGVPEAALQGVLPGKLENLIAGQVGGKFLTDTLKTGAAQIPIGAATEFLTQEMGDPNRSFADRSQDIVNSALNAGVIGVATAGFVHPAAAAIHAIAKTPVANVTTGSLFDILRKASQPVEPTPQPETPNIYPQTPEGFQQPLPGLENLPDQTAPQPGDANIQGQLNFNQPAGPDPEQLAMSLRGGNVQGDLFQSLFGVPRPFEFGPGRERAAPIGDVNQLEQGTLPGMENLPEGTKPRNDVGYQPGFDFNRPAEEQPEAPQQRLPLGAHQMTFEDVGRLGPAGGFDQGAIPAITAEHATPQKGMTLEEAKAQAANNDNLPPTHGLSQEQVDLLERLRDPMQMKGGRGVNDETGSPGATADATGQKPLELAKPGENTPVNQSPFREPTPQSDIKGPITDAAGLRKAGLTSVDVGKETANGPANLNREGPGATAEPTKQPSAIKPAIELTVANDKLDLTPLKPDLNKLPEFRGKEFKTTQEFQQAVADSINARDADPRKTVPPALERIATAMKVTDESGNVRPEFRAADEPLEGPEGPEGPEETLQAGPQLPDRAAREAVPEKQQGRWDRLEALRQRLQGDPASPLLKETADLQNELQDVKGSQRTAEITRAIKRLEGDADAADRAQTATPSEDPKALASSTEPSPAAQEFVAARQGEPQTAEAKAKAKRQGRQPKAVQEAPKTLPENIPEVNSAPPEQDQLDAMTNEGGREPPTAEPEPMVPQTKEAQAKAKRAAPAPKEPKAETLPARKAATRVSREDVQRVEANKDAKAESQTVQAIEAVEQSPGKKTPVPGPMLAQIAEAQRTLNALKAQRENTNNPEIFDRMIAKQQQRLDVIMKGGSLEGLQNIRSNHFGDELFTRFLGRMGGPEGEAALGAHVAAEQNILDSLHALRGERPLIRYESQPTQHDVDLTHVIRQTGDLGSALDFIKQSDPSPALRAVASWLSRLGLKTSIKMAEDSEMLNDTTRKLGEGEVIAGSHNDQLNRINIYDGSQVSRTVVHEAIHAATVRALQSGSAAARTMKNLFETFKARAGDLASAYGFKNVEEFVAEASTNPQLQQFLKSEPYQINGVRDLWQGFKNAVFKMLRMPDSMKTGFDQVMDTTNKLMGENPTLSAVAGERAMQAQRGFRQFNDAVDMLGQEGRATLARAAQGKASNVKEAITKGIMGWTGSLDIAKVIGDRMGTAMDYVRTIMKGDNRRDTLGKPEVAAMNMANHLSPKMRDAINELAAHTMQRIDGLKPWKDHDHLQNLSNSKALEAEHAKAAKAADVLRGGDGAGMKAYIALRDANRAKSYGRDVHLAWEHANTVDPELMGKPGFESDPFEKFERAYAEQDDPTKFMNLTKAQSELMRNTMDARLTELQRERDKMAKQVKADDSPANQARLSPTERSQLDDKLESTRKLIRQTDGLTRGMDSMQEQNDQAPYFHMGRQGEHFVSAYLAKDENGLPKQSALDALRTALEAKGFKNVAVLSAADSDGFYARLNSTTEREQMFDVIKDLAKKGHIDKDKKMSRGFATQNDVFNAITPQAMREFIESVRQNPPEPPPGADQATIDKIEAQHRENVAELMRGLVQLIPQTGLNRLYQYREGVQGFEKDMLKNYQTSAVSNSAGLSNLTLARQKGQAVKAMRDQLKEINANPDAKGSDVTLASQVYSELMGRAQGVKTQSTAGFMSAIRQATHTISVGLSPAYFMTLMGQIATLSLPQLGAVHGFVRSAQALAKHTTPAMKVMAAVARGPDAATFGLRHETLTGAGLSSRDVEFHMDMARRGAYAQGYTEAMTGHEAHSTLGKAQHYANMLGRYSEMFPRVQLALAARDLFEQNAAAGKKTIANGKEFTNANDYAQYAVEEAQLDWSRSSTARQQTAAGSFGVMSPFMNQFMGFQTRMTAKLYREVHGALGGDAQSQKWLLAHAGAVATLSGTLGLPMVAVAASVYDKLADWATGEDNHDVQASFRTFLAHTFGKEVGEVIARGAPRALGIDYEHASESKIVPGSTALMMLTEKRKLEDAQSDWLKAEAGHSVGYLFHLAAAARDLSNGDYLDASTRLVPEALQGPLDAYRLSKRGFVDRNGQELPITATAADVMMTAMGIDPAKEAEYDEEAKVASGLKAMRQVRSQNITRHLLLAQSRGDGAMFQKWEQEASQFTQDHPGQAGPLQEFGRTMMTKFKSVALARGSGTPVGMNARDISGREMTAFGNLRNQ